MFDVSQSVSFTFTDFIYIISKQLQTKTMSRISSSSKPSFLSRKLSSASSSSSSSSSSIFNQHQSIQSNLYGRRRGFPPQSNDWMTTLQSNNLPARFTQSSFNKDLNCSNAEMVRIKSRSPPFVRDGMMFEPEMIDQKTSPECFEGNAKFQWLSSDGWCHLCQEPFSNASIHVGEREHQCMSVFVFLYTIFPHRARNQWSAKRVLAEACHFGQRQKMQGLTQHTAKIANKKYWMVKSNDTNPISQLGHLARCDPMTIEPSHLFTMDDKQRLDELEALMTFAATRDMEKMTEDVLLRKNNMTTEETEGQEYAEEFLVDHQCDEVLNLEGEEDFSSDVTNSIKANDDGAMTFETSSSVRASRNPTLFAHVLQSKHQIPLHSQGEKLFRAAIARMIAEMLPGLSPVSFSQFEHKCYGRTNEEMLYCRLNIGKIQELVGGTALQTKDQRAYCMRNIFWELIFATEYRCDEVLDPVIVTIGREILRRLSFELIYSMSMHFMNKAQLVVEMLGYPEVEDLARYNSL